jgi:hypothetical protein
MTVAETELALEVGAPERVGTGGLREGGARGPGTPHLGAPDEAVAVEHGVDDAFGRQTDVAGQAADEELPDIRVKPEYKPCTRPSGASRCWRRSTSRNSSASPTGFRPGRGQHDALDALHVGILRRQVNWVLDADIQGFFDAMSHSWITRFLEHRIADKRILRLVAKWLKVGIVEDGRVTLGTRGAPQGAVISPILANVYLHYVYDLWAHRWRHTKASGDMIVVRYADDTMVGFQHEHEAKAFLHDLQERMRGFELALHPDRPG